MLDLSENALDKLRLYQSELTRWQKKINLVSNATLGEVWQRHIVDGLQLAPLIEGGPLGSWMDLGSGGGLPAIPLAIWFEDKGIPVPSIQLVEADKRKAAFLNAMRRHLDLRFEVLSERLESLNPGSIELITARAFKPLPELLGLVSKHIGEKTRLVLPKGRSWHKELEDAQDLWHLSCTDHPSQTALDARILVLENIRKR